MVKFVDVQRRAVRYLRAVVPAVPDDTQRSVSLLVMLDRRRAVHPVVADGSWVASIHASWCSSNGSTDVSLDVPLVVLLSGEDAAASGTVESSW